MLETIVTDLLQASFEGASISVSMEGNHCQINIVTDKFEGMRQLKRQQQVYALLNDKIASGEIHAVHFSLKTPVEAANS